MTLAIPIEDKTHNSDIALRFARAKYFAIVNKDQHSLEILPNPCLGLSVQAGKCTILYLTTRKNVDTLLAYELGLNVQQIAQKNNLQLILISEKRKSLNQLLKIMNIKTKI
jgi:predicted Fe-Mo cluster-binding NifX family protein